MVKTLRITKSLHALNVGKTSHPISRFGNIRRDASLTCHKHRSMKMNKMVFDQIGKFADNDDDIYIHNGDVVDYHRLTLREIDIVNKEWEELPLHTTYLCLGVSSEKTMYDHISDKTVSIRILTIQEDVTGNVWKCLAPYAFMEQFDAIDLPCNSRIFFQKWSSIDVKWKYK